jgi:hypothetical protein
MPACRRRRMAVRIYKFLLASAARAHGFCMPCRPRPTVRRFCSRRGPSQPRRPPSAQANVGRVRGGKAAAAAWATGAVGRPCARQETIAFATYGPARGRCGLWRLVGGRWPAPAALAEPARDGRSLRYHHLLTCLASRESSRLFSPPAPPLDLGLGRWGLTREHFGKLARGQGACVFLLSTAACSLFSVVVWRDSDLPHTTEYPIYVARRVRRPEPRISSACSTCKLL